MPPIEVIANFTADTARGSCNGAVPGPLCADVHKPVVRINERIPNLLISRLRHCEFFVELFSNDNGEDEQIDFTNQAFREGFRARMP